MAASFCRLIKKRKRKGQQNFASLRTRFVISCIFNPSPKTRRPLNRRREASPNLLYGTGAGGGAIYSRPPPLSGYSPIEKRIFIQNLFKNITLNFHQNASERSPRLHARSACGGQTKHKAEISVCLVRHAVLRRNKKCLRMRVCFRAYSALPSYEYQAFLFKENQ